MRVPLLLFLLVTCQWVSAQLFSRFPTNLPSELLGYFYWADWDADGDYDALYFPGFLGDIAFYRNDGNGNFTDLGFSFPRPTTTNARQWIDYDNDNDVDFFYDSQNVLVNDGNGNFTLSTLTLPPGPTIPYGFADYNQDGKTDFLAYSGFNNAATNLFLNDGQGGWNQAPNWTPVLNGPSNSVGVADYDKDGDIDIVAPPVDPTVTFPLGGYSQLSIYENDGSASFTTSTFAIPTSVTPTSVQLYLEELNGDNFLDIFTSFVNSAEVPGVTVPFTISIDINGPPVLDDTFIGTYPGFNAEFFSDFDKDGDIDILATGPTSGSSLQGTVESYFHENQNNGTFNTIADPIPALFKFGPSNATMVDIDLDNDLDLVVFGREGFLPQDVYFFRTNGGTNTPPPAPSGLTASIDGCNGTELRISWTAPADAETPSSELTYNLRVGTTPGGSDVVSPLALPNGHQLIPGYGKLRTTSFTLRNAPLNQPLYIAVQAIDQSGGASPFSAELTWTSTFQAPFQDLGFTNPTGFQGGLQWGDYDNDGDLDYFACGRTSFEPFRDATPGFQLFQNNNGTFTPVPTGIPGILRGDAEWTDYDNDGDLDLFLSGETGFSGVNAVTVHALYENNGGTFTEIPLPDQSGQIEFSRVIDIDGDGRKDIVNTYSPDQTGYLVAVEYQRPNGFEAPQPLVIASLGFRFCNQEWADLNEDGNPDLILFGPVEGNTLAAATKVLRNEGAGIFTERMADLGPAFTGATVKAFDFDRDGDLDILTHSGDNGNVSTIRVNEGDFDFSSQVNLGSFSLGTPTNADFGDFDNNGVADLFLSYETPSGIEHQVLTNDGGVFSALCTNFPDIFNFRSAVEWGDVDQDGDLDVLLASYDNSDVGITKVFENRFTTTPNSVPNPPTFIRGFRDCGELNLSWDSGSDAETANQSLSYDLQVGTTPGGSDIYSGISHLTPTSGEFVNFRITLSELPAGTVYYSVRSVDAGFAVSPSSVEGSTLVLNQPYDRFDPVYTTDAYPNERISMYDWADYDRDGDMDYLNTRTFSSSAPGEIIPYISELATLEINGESDNEAPLVLDTTFVRDASSALRFHPENKPHNFGWIDYNRDGQMDVYGYYFSDSLRVFIYLNQNGTFTKTQIASFPGQYGFIGSLHWTDFNNDGLADMLIADRFLTADGWRAFVQERNGSFTEIPIPIGTDEQRDEFLKIVDLDADGQLDIVTDRLVLGSASSIYQISNDFNNQFTEIDLFPGDPLYHNLLDDRGSNPSDFGDFDNDGRTDIFSRFWQPFEPRFGGTGIAFGGDGSFQFDAFFTTSNFVQFGDLNNDGLLDMMGTKSPTFGFVNNVELRTNDGMRGLDFQCVPVSGIWNNTHLIDGDGDNDLDMVVEDRFTSAPQFNLRNASIIIWNDEGTNNSPNPPTQLSSSRIDAQSVQLRWNRGNDTETPAAGLTYNLRIGTAPGLSDVYASNTVTETSHPLFGRRMVDEPGNVWQALSKQINDLDPNQTYYWSIQSIDHSYADGAFAPEQVFTLSTQSGTTTIQGAVNNSNNAGFGLLAVEPCDPTITNPVAGATVFLTDAATGDVLLSTLTDNSGNFSFPDVTDGSYNLMLDFNGLPMSMGNPVVEATGDTVLNYVITVTNSAIEYCQVGTSPELAVVLSGTDVQCAGGMDGSATAEASGGTTPYTYIWSNGETTPSINSLAADTYSVTVTDATGEMVVENITIDEPAPLNVTADIENASSSGAADGSITTTVTGGTTPYAYLWNTGATESNLTDLRAGNYDLTVTDANGCSETRTFTLTEPSPTLALTLQPTNIDCNGAATGSITTTVTGGISPYTYMWSTGASTPAIEGLTVGTYSITVTDNSGATVSNAVALMEPSAIQVAGSTIDASSEDDTDGQITTSIAGGTPPYSYQWNTGNTTADLIGVPAGTYNLTVTDTNGCTSSESFTVGVRNTSDGPRIIGFEVFLEDGRVLLANLPDGGTINLGAVGATPINIRALTEPTIVGSVEFDLEGPLNVNRTENVVTYDLFGSNGRNIPIGSYTLTATPYTQARKAGQAGMPLTVTFDVVYDLRVLQFQLLDAAGAVIDPDLAQGEVIDLNTAGTGPLNIRALTDSDNAATVNFRLAGPLSVNRTEISAPFLVFSEGNAQPLPVGTYQLEAEPVLLYNGVEQAVGTALAIDFSVRLMPFVERFRLVDAARSVLDDPLEDGDIIDLSQTGPVGLNIEAVTDPRIVGSVRLTLDGPVPARRTENFVPYEVFGNGSRPLEVGSYTLIAEPFSQQNTGGVAGMPDTVQFEVIRSSNPQAIAAQARLRNPAGSTALNLFPNPTQGQFTIQWTAPYLGAVELRIVDVAGRMVLRQSLQKEVDILQHQLNIAHLETGLYEIQLVGQDFLEHHRVVLID